MEGIFRKARAAAGAARLTLIGVAGSAIRTAHPGMRRIARATLTPALRGAIATKQSMLPRRRRGGLLRGACHRARIRATRWLAMTEFVSFTMANRRSHELEQLGTAAPPLAVHHLHLGRDRQYHRHDTAAAGRLDRPTGAGPADSAAGDGAVYVRAALSDVAGDGEGIDAGIATVIAWRKQRTRGSHDGI